MGPKARYGKKMYVEACGRQCGGHGITIRNKKVKEARFQIFKWKGAGAIKSGDFVYLRNPSHNNEFVEACGPGYKACKGYGISTVKGKMKGDQPVYSNNGN